MADEDHTRHMMVLMLIGDWLSDHSSLITAKGTAPHVAKFCILQSGILGR
jgi:hypothetical protein